ncbi:MAG TPA: hypothetical protein VEH50_13785 [Methylomirabilota bacterium]|jgi:hypothetical protein|nr:hypothetical protein [Methylomirabilota bacterium]
MGPGIALFFFLAVGAVALFSFLAVGAWSGTRLKEREAYYESEMLKKIAETQGAAANPALEFLREKERIARAKQHEGLKVGGLVLVGAGIGLLIFLAKFGDTQSVYLVGLIPLFIGLALLSYGFFLAPKV